MYESASLNLACLVLAVICLLPDLLYQVYEAHKDVRVKEKLRKVYSSLPIFRLVAVFAFYVWVLFLCKLCYNLVVSKVVTIYILNPLTNFYLLLSRVRLPCHIA